MALELPALSGTEAQIARAEKVRTKAHQRWITLVEKYERGSVDRDGRRGDPDCLRWLAVERPLIEAWLVVQFFGRADAKHWIENAHVDVVTEANSDEVLLDARRVARKQWVA